MRPFLLAVLACTPAADAGSGHIGPQLPPSATESEAARDARAEVERTTSTLGPLTRIVDEDYGVVCYVVRGGETWTVDAPYVYGYDQVSVRTVTNKAAYGYAAVSCVPLPKVTP